MKQLTDGGLKYMKFIPENFVCYDDIASADGQGVSIEVRLCRSCPLFRPDGIQVEKPIIHGWCARLSDEELPHYIHVTTEDFCREDRIKDEIL